MVSSVVGAQFNCSRCGLPVAADRAFCDHCGAPNVAYPAVGQEEEPQEFIAVRIGDVLEGKWRLERRLGTGGMGTVYLAHDLQLDRKVAVKILGSSFAGDAEVMARFEREARITASLEHTNIVHVYSVGRLENRPFMVMKYLPGRTLAAYIRERGQLQRDELLPIMRQICGGLDFIHSRFFIHRDIKAGNIFISPEGRVTILDFGILRSAKNPDALTRAGILVGTPQYMSPEQARGEKDIDHRSDIYALAILLYECLTGSLPFESNSELSIIQMQAYAPPPDLAERAPWVPLPVAAVVKRALAKNPNDRFSSAGELLIALEQAYVEVETGQPAPSIPQAVAAHVNDQVLLASPQGASSSQMTRPSMRKLSDGEQASGGESQEAWPHGAADAPVTPSRVAGAVAANRAALSPLEFSDAGPETIELMRAVKNRRRSAYMWILTVCSAGGVLYFAARSIGSGSTEKAAAVSLDKNDGSKNENVASLTPPTANLPAAAKAADSGAEVETFGLKLELSELDAGAVAKVENPPPPVDTATEEPIRVRSKRAPHTAKKVASLTQGQLNIVTTFKGDAYWAGVTVDGVPRGNSPLLLELVPGKHKVRVERSGFKPVEKEIKIARGRPAVLRIELAP